MWTFLVIYLIGCLITYVIIGHVNDTEPGDDLAFGFVFLSWLMVVMTLMSFIGDKVSKAKPPTLKRKKNGKTNN